jgi:hypothetical protein
MLGAVTPLNSDRGSPQEMHMGCHRGPVASGYSLRKPGIINPEQVPSELLVICQFSDWHRCGPAEVYGEPLDLVDLFEALSERTQGRSV